MKFVSYEYNEGVKFGAVIDDGIIDLSDAGPSLKAVLGAGPLDNLIKVAETRSPTVDLDHVILHQVIPDTDRILCVGKNYKDHAKEMGGEVAGNPNIFMRTAQSVVGHQQSVIMPMISEQYDFEGELAVVIGRGGRHIDVDRALEHVAGYTCFLVAPCGIIRSTLLLLARTLIRLGRVGRGWFQRAKYQTHKTYI
jgi:2-keto-4-pentenoate hydratase/2-oxohepta-3-ene-1,7-dioic acid hydratase in catechol pathway